MKKQLNVDIETNIHIESPDDSFNITPEVERFIYKRREALNSRFRQEISDYLNGPYQDSADDAYERAMKGI